VSEKATALSAKEFNSLLETFEPFEESPRIAVAVSGGSDSLALTLLLHEWVQRRQGTLIALTVDHQLRAESAQEAQQVGEWLKTYDIPHVILQWQHTQPRTGLQEAARLARYQLLEKWCQHNEYLHLFLGHQLEDQYETIILRTLNKSGLIGLAGMSTIIEKQYLRILRPLLTIPKARLNQFLMDKGQEWIEDPSNTKPQFQRNKIRQLILHKDLDVIQNQSGLQKYRQSFERWLNCFLAHSSRVHPFGFAELKMSPFLMLPIEFQKPILLRILKTIGVGKYPPRTAALASILTRMQQESFKAVTCHGVRIAIRKDYFLFVREHMRVKEEWTSCDLQNVHTIHFDQRFEVKTLAFKQEAEGEVCIKKVGEDGWKQLICHYPALKELSLHKPALWGLPAAWRGQEILLKYNMIYEWLIMPQEKGQQKNFIFKPHYNLSCFIFSKSS
jgi:tRNA(Ile)-lysidine synthase